MANIMLIHGAYGNPKENWFPYLKEKLEKEGHNIIIPKFPTPENQTLERWIEVFKDYEFFLDKNTILVGHSLGCAFILHILERIDKQIRAAFFVAGFVGPLNNPAFDSINRTFTENTFNWRKIKNNCKEFIVINSKDDPYVPIQKGIYLSEKLKASLIKISNAGHFNDSSGYKEFRYLLDKLESVILSL